MKIENAIVMITGGASGLGAATAVKLAQSGAKVVILDTNLEAAKNIADSIGAIAIACNVTDEAMILEAIQVTKNRFGIPNVLVNCAGIAPSARVVGREGPMPLHDFSKVIEVNLIGSFNMMRLVAADMIQTTPDDQGERGIIISTASAAAYEGQIGQVAYAASKGGIVSMTLPAARELARFGIRVNAIAPGLFMTPLLASMSDEIKKNLAASIPFPGRLGAPEEFADLVLHLIENRYINGTVIRLDGALRMQAK
ncbi:MAG: SDR family oxidoreductase [Saprospiraceae bacterium]|jgi:NAD(P)-dependent dehydrogenase (short-subunit alcohol dehydrogenase family)|nr:SDR family oxidoreductase [Saprospiraceae bacterium]MBK6480994.1 SDR family oxidoreductase [Saprospiraceae bacterium]MBK6815605.1 SDR family oxidoreductase [Saprospiraceae bacterium]MBK7373965.1 SDR family oxidoreductase [Saprospiraceae bacterium]MBK7439270.1 SDR family oxidoreductase [Saprospiraceae bacterium]